MLFKPDDVPYFGEFLDAEYERTSNLVEDYDYPGGYVVLIYKLDPDLNRDFNIVRQGKYSRTSKKFQKISKSYKDSKQERTTQGRD